MSNEKALCSITREAMVLDWDDVVAGLQTSYPDRIPRCVPIDCSSSREQGLLHESYATAGFGTVLIREASFLGASFLLMLSNLFSQTFVRNCFAGTAGHWIILWLQRVG
jgi:hypothetical protein